MPERRNTICTVPCDECGSELFVVGHDHELDIVLVCANCGIGGLLMEALITLEARIEDEHSRN